MNEHKAVGSSIQTQAGIIKGKYYYMSPEQAMGRLIDARTDIFAAGILLCESDGTREEVAEELEQHLTEERLNRISFAELLRLDDGLRDLMDPKLARKR